MPDLSHIGGPVEQFEGVAYAFRGDIAPVKDGFDPVLLRVLVQDADEGHILRNVDVRHSRFEHGQLEVAHLLPVYDFGEKVETQSVDEAVYVAHRYLGVPSSVHMEHEGSEAVFRHHLVQHIGTVSPSAESHDAVEIMSPPFLLQVFGETLKSLLSLSSLMPMFPDDVFELPVMVRDTVLVEGDGWV